MKKVLLVDGNNLLFRSYYATAYNGNFMKNSKGFPTNALYGFVGMMNKIIHEEKPESLEDISDKFNVPLEDILEMEPSIREKVDAAIQQREVFFGHDPIKRQRQKSK